VLAAVYLPQIAADRSLAVVDSTAMLPAAAVPLPATATRAPGEEAVGLLSVTMTPAATATPLPGPTMTPIPADSTPVSVQPAEGWSFEGVRLQPAPDLGGLLVYGEAINDSGGPQRILGLQGIFYDAQGGEIAPEEISEYWPIETVPQGWRMPFELTLIGPPAIDRLDLQLITEASDEPLRSDLELSQLEGAEQSGEYCVQGQVRNPGSPLEAYLMVVTVLYDADDGVINYGVGYQPASAELTGDATAVVSACADTMGLPVARYEMRAWGE
jgi:hypothetical protein